MSRALWLLLFLAVRARYRRITRGLLSLKGFLLMFCGLGFFALVVVVPLVARNTSDIPQLEAPAANPVQRFGPVGILIFALLSVFSSTKYRGVYFSPAEVDFLFQGPFTRRELLIYRLATQFVYTTLSVFIMSAILFPYFQGFWQTAAGLFFTFVFLNLVQISGSLLAGSLQERAVARGRRFIISVLVLFALLVFCGFTAAFSGGNEIRESLRNFLGSQMVGWILLPLKTFSETLAASDLKSFLSWGAGALAVDLLLLGLVLRLDIDYTESSLETSRKIFQRVQQLRKGGRLVQSGQKLRWNLPMPSRWGGVGVVAWRQAQEMVRETPGAVYLLFAFTAGALLPLAIFSEGEDFQATQIATSISGIVIILPFILSNWFRFDFRGDLERMELLLGLPIPPALVAFGQILVPALILTALQLAGFGFVLWALGSSESRIFFQILILLCFPLNLLYIALENLFFLIYPVRLAPTAPGDFQALGRMMFSFAVKMIVLLLVVSLGLLVSFVAYTLTGESLFFGILAGGIFLILADGGAVLLVGWAFARFDVSRPPPD